MKKLRDLKGTYGSNDISNLVAFAQDAPIMLQDNQNYHFDKSGRTIHIYGIEMGIDNYKISCAEAYACIGNVSVTKSGVEIDIAAEGIEKIILHNKAYSKATSEAIAQGAAGNSYESRESLDSRIFVSYGESRGCGESRGGSGGESRGDSGGESRGWSGGESRGYSGGESRGRSSGESRW